MTPILLKTSLRHLLKHPWQVGLAILGVALGVAVVVSIDLTNSSAQRAFALSTETIAGRATHQIVGGPNGLNESVYRTVRLGLGVRQSAPLVEGYAAAPDHPGLTLHILGMDPLVDAPFRSFNAGAGGSSGALGSPADLFTKPGAALLSADTARAYGLKQNDQLRIRIGARVERATLIALIEPPDETARRALDGLLIADISTAQEWLGSIGKLSEIDLILPDGAAGQALAEKITAALPPGAQLTRPALRTQAIEQMTAAFELNLTALSLLALIVGMIGAAAGLVLGVLLGRGLIGLVTQTINDLYFTVSVRGIALSAGPLIKGALLGLLTTLVAAAVPAFEATFTPPRTVLRRSSYEDRARRIVPLAGVAGLGMLALGGALLLVPSKNLVLSFSALFVITIGAAATTPLVTLLLMRVARPALGAAFGMLGRMAARDVVATLSRTSVAIAALMIAISVTIGVGLMVGSFRQTVIQWLDQTLRADVYVSAPGFSGTRTDARMPPELVRQLSSAPGVERAR